MSTAVRSPDSLGCSGTTLHPAVAPRDAGSFHAHTATPQILQAPQTTRRHDPGTSLDPEERNVRLPAVDRSGILTDSVAEPTDDPNLADRAPRHVPNSRLMSDTAFRHSGWQHNRSLVRSALQRRDVPKARLERWDNCGSNAWVVRDVEDRSRLAVVASYCHDRFCRPCANQRSRTIVGNLLPLLSKKPHRFITLTLKSGNLTLTEMVDKLYRCFRRLRSSKLCKRRLRGGVAFLELKWVKVTEHWHPHLHVICEGTFIPQDQLAAAWKKVTGDSYIVDIRFVADRNQVAKYVTKYASKPLSGTFLNRPEQLDDAINVLQGRRLFTTFGTWRGWRLLEVRCTTTWESVAPLWVLRRDAAAGDPRAIAILLHVGATRPCQQSRDPPNEPTEDHLLSA